MIHNQSFPEHEQAWFNFFQMIQQHLQPPSLEAVQSPNFVSADESLAEYISEVIQHVNAPKGRRALESAGINPQDLIKLLRDTQEHLSYSRSSRKQYLEPLKRYCKLKEEVGRMQESFRPKPENSKLQSIRQKIAAAIESSHPIEDFPKTLDSPDNHEEASSIAKAIEKDKQDLIEDFPQGDAKKIISEYYDAAIRKFEIPDI